MQKCLELFVCDLLCLTETYIMAQMFVATYCVCPGPVPDRPQGTDRLMAELCKDLWPLNRSDLYLLFMECSKLGPQPVSFRRTRYVFTNKRDRDIKIGGSFPWSWTSLNVLVDISMSRMQEFSSGFIIVGECDSVWLTIMDPPTALQPLQKILCGHL